MSLDPLTAAWRALDEGRPEEALEALAELPHVDREAQLVEGLARLELGELELARRAIQGAARGLPSDHVDLAWAQAELLLREWRVEEARQRFEGLRRRGQEAAVLDRLSLCLELAEDLSGAEQLLGEAAALDPERFPLPPRLAEREFDAVVAAAVQGLPAPYRAALERARLVTEPVPFPALAASDDPGATPPDLLGLFVGPTLHELAEDVSAELPPTIYLFQRNLERAARDRAHLEEEIRTTLFHELGHLLGLDEDGVDALGLA